MGEHSWILRLFWNEIKENSLSMKHMFYFCGELKSRYTTNDFRQAVCYVQTSDNRKISMQLLSGASGRLRHHNYIRAKNKIWKFKIWFLLFAEDVVWIIGLILVVYVRKRPIFHLSLSRSWHLSLCMKAKPLGEALKRFCFRQVSRNKTTRMDQLRVSKNAHPD